MLQSFFKSKAVKILANANIEIDGKHPWDMQIHDQSLFADVFFKGSLGLGDGYASGKWDVEQIDVFFERLLKSQAKYTINIKDLLQSTRDILINSQAGKRAFHVGHKHYNLGNQMYELMLGESMGYSSGIFLNSKDDLTKAQYNKFDILCKKLDLKPGMKILEIGSGWGTFARHAATNYGVEIVGLTVSSEQKGFAENRCKNLPAKFLLLNYQNLDKKYTNYFDRVVSIEMIEAVGRKNLTTFFSIIKNALKDTGLFGLQSITGLGETDTFLSTRIFPNGYVPSQKEVVTNSAKFFTIKHWECFGKDYEKTLLLWENKFRTQWDKISNSSAYDQEFYRMWRYYLLLCAASFRVSRNDVAQIIMSPI